MRVQKTKRIIIVSAIVLCFQFIGFIHSSHAALGMGIIYLGHLGEVIGNIDEKDSKVPLPRMFSAHPVKKSGLKSLLSEEPHRAAVERIK